MGRMRDVSHGNHLAFVNLPGGGFPDFLPLVVTSGWHLPAQALSGLDKIVRQGNISLAR